MAYRVTEFVNSIASLLKEIEALEKELDTVEKIALTKCLTEVLPVLSQITVPIIIEYKKGDINEENTEEHITYFEHEGIKLYELYKYIPISGYKSSLKIESLIYCVNGKLYTTISNGVSREEPYNYTYWKAEVNEVDIDYVVSTYHIRDVINTVENVLRKKVRELNSIKDDRTTNINALKRYIGEDV